MPSGQAALPAAGEDVMWATLVGEMRQHSGSVARRAGRIVGKAGSITARTAGNTVAKAGEVVDRIRRSDEGKTAADPEARPPGAD